MTAEYDGGVQCKGLSESNQPGTSNQTMPTYLDSDVVRQ